MGSGPTWSLEEKSFYRFTNKIQFTLSDEGPTMQPSLSLEMAAPGDFVFKHVMLRTAICEWNSTQGSCAGAHFPVHDGHH